MDEVISWTNSNTGFVMVILTAVYVLATILIVLESRRSNRLTASLEEDRNRPHIIFWIEDEMRTSSSYFFDIRYVGKVRNEGRSTAHSINIKTNPVLSARQGVDKGGNQAYYTPIFLKEETSIMVPGQTLTEVIGPTRFILEDNHDEELKYKVLIEYSDALGKHYSSEYEIDLSRGREKVFREDAQAKAFFDLLDSANKIARSMSDLQRTLDQPDRSNFLHRDTTIQLSDGQVKLLRDICEADTRLGKTGDLWILRETVDGSTVWNSSSTNKIELSTESYDVVALCQAGYLLGHYRSGILMFKVAASAISLMKHRSSAE